MITQKTIQEVIEVAKVEDVVGDFVSLKNRGINMIGLCPFHNEKTPSFTVSPQKNIYKCFGCGQAGNPINFVMEHEGMSYPEALKYLAGKYGIEVEETGNRDENLKEKQFRDSLFIVNEFAKKYYQNQMFNTDLGKSIGLSYFKERGFREDTVTKFELGYAPEKGDAFTLAAVQKQYHVDILKKVGLSNQYGKDFFRGRVMFPIRNLSGKVIGFGGRILDSRKKTAKYMNTPETEIYNKSKVLFGIYHAKKAIRQLDECILVEGYTDVISLNQAGIENVVSSSGTSLTVGQILLVKRYTPNMTILYDGDAAGVKAALRGLDLVLEQGLNVKIVQLPEGEDPDSYVQKVGTTAFKEYFTANAKDFILFKTNLMLRETANDPIKKAQLIKDIVESIARIPDPIKRAVYTRECANLMDMNEEVLINETNKIVHKLVNKSSQQSQQKSWQQSPRQQPKPQPPTGSQDPFFPGQEPFFGDEYPPDMPIELIPQQATAPKQAAKPKTDEFQEKDIIRILIEHGTEEIDEGVTVAQCVLEDMQDLMDDFENETYSHFIKIYFKSFENGNLLTQQQLSNHTDTVIQQLAIDILSFPYDYSENWVNRFEKPLESRAVPKAYFKRDMLSSINRFKLKKLQKLSRENQNRLKNMPSSNFEEMMRILRVQKRLTEMKGKLADLLNTVILE